MSFRRAARLGPGGVLLLLALFLSGCGTLEVERLATVHPGLPEHSEITDVPFHPQDAYQCGPAALAMALNWAGDPVDPDDLAPSVYTASRKGSLQSTLVSATRRQGRVAYRVSGMANLLAEVAAGHPVVVLQNLAFFWYPIWHYAVVIGFDLPAGDIFLHSGTHPRESLPVHLFERTWARSGEWGLLVLPPGKMPVRVDEDTYLEAVVGLEHAQQWEGAVEAYSAARRRWPRSLGAAIGLANSYYALGQLTQAETVLRNATRDHPDSAPAFNNLAQVLAELGRHREAAMAARRAVDLGGPDPAIYRKTLSEIESAQHRSNRVRSR
jgi:hypothetical protein